MMRVIEFLIATAQLLLIMAGFVLVCMFCEWLADQSPIVTALAAFAALAIFVYLEVKKYGKP